ncbi:hypothetical protein ACTXJ2_08450 [Psychrobacter alimentarius]|uniref:hypothetical protein n=1 Tax=Psychrobacter alimentarius TaxID=261164 RepID=UPI003FD34BD6
MISSCLKVQVGNSPSFIISFTGANLEYAVDSVGNLDDLIVFSHIYNFFGFKSRWTYTAPTISITGTPYGCLIGHTVDSENSIGHPDNLSLACFTQQSLRDELSSQVPFVNGSYIMSEEEWRALVESTSFENFNSLLSEAQIGNEMTVITEPTTLKVMRCTSADMLTLPPRHSDAPNYSDAFNLVKARLVNKVAVLDSNGLAPAVYHADGDYIEFTADCAIQISIPEPELNPVPIPT